MFQCPNPTQVRRLTLKTALLEVFLCPNPMQVRSLTPKTALLEVFHCPCPIQKRRLTPNTASLVTSVSLSQSDAGKKTRKPSFALFNTKYLGSQHLASSSNTLHCCTITEERNVARHWQQSAPKPRSPPTIPTAIHYRFSGTVA